MKHDLKLRDLRSLQELLDDLEWETELIGEEAAIRLVGAIEKPKTTLVERVVIEGNLVPGQSVGMIQVDE